MQQFNQFAAYTILSASVLQLVLAEEAGLQPMHLMPYQLVDSTDTHSNIMQAVQRDALLTPTVVAGVMGEALRPNMNSGVVAPITNGWGTRRFRFGMKVRVENAMGSVFLYMITGYTDYSDVSFAGSVDPNMVLNINSYQKIHEQSAAASITLPVGINEIQAGSDVLKNTNDASQVAGLMLQRPSDIYLISQDAAFAQASGNQLGLHSSTMCPLGATAQLASSFQTSPCRWASDYLLAATAPTAGLNGDPAMEHSERASRLQTASLVKEDFFRMLTQMLHDTGSPAAARLTISQLQEIDPTLLQRTVVVPFAPDANMGALVTGDNRQLATIAAMYAQSVPAYMNMCGLSSVEFIQMARGNTLDQRPGHCVVTSAMTFVGNRPVEQLTYAFQHAMQSEMFPAASFSHNYPFSIRMTCALFGYAHIDISDLFGTTEKYSFPIYANSPWNPMVTADPNGYIQLASGMNALANTAQLQMPNHNYQNYDVLS